ncbi:benzoate/H(+) symporter BenE family transporter [Salinispirillum sp. LH 10-3-1]|uniref:Benzoate/H(+) symporter BenE family transporter n=1 Tax=Salinispirillum sp. LH 10-3-1 TaxID=2952525 RepID=A0AB38YD36_9GAMM
MARSNRLSASSVQQLRWHDVSLSALIAGFVAVLVGYTSSAIIIFQAVASAGGGPELVTSWFLALGIGMGITTIGLTLRFRAPILTAWSTPGAALLVTSMADFSYAAAIGAFLFSACLITLVGITGWFERLMNRIPQSIAAAMLAGVLLQFGLGVFQAMENEWVLVVLLFVVYLVAKRWQPRYAIPLVLVVGMLAAWAMGLLSFATVEWQLAKPVFTLPEWSLGAMISIGVPLFIVTMASQNMPGVATIRASGYQTPISPTITWTGITTLLLAPFGAFALNLAAITAAICMSSEAHPDAKRRYVATLSAGFFYLLTGLLASTMAALFYAFPEALVLAIAGLALLATIGNSLAVALHDEPVREAALITFLVTASGVTLFSVGSAFWGLVAGLAAWYVRRP